MRAKVDRRQMWLSFQRARAAYIKIFKEYVRQALLESVRPVQRAVVQRGHVSQELAVLVSDEPIRLILTRLYGNVGARFWVAVWRSLGFAKQDIEPLAQEQVERLTRLARNFLLAEGGKLIKNITETTRKEVAKLLGEFELAGLGATQAAMLLSARYAQDFSFWRAERIVRTETTRASNWGIVNGGLDLAARHGIAMSKEWIAVQDDRTRDLLEEGYGHLEADGQRVPINEPFQIQTVFGIERLLYPGDPAGSAANTINCRCATTVLID